jgi:hypothetical protein
MAYDEQASAVTYHSDKPSGPTAGSETTDALEFLARLTIHIPNKGQVVQRYCGWYSSRQRGSRRNAAGEDVARPIVTVDPEPETLREARRRRSGTPASPGVRRSGDRWGARGPQSPFRHPPSTHQPRFNVASTPRKTRVGSVDTFTAPRHPWQGVMEIPTLVGRSVLRACATPPVEPAAPPGAASIDACTAAQSASPAEIEPSAAPPAARSGESAATVCISER